MNGSVNSNGTGMTVIVGNNGNTDNELVFGSKAVPLKPTSPQEWHDNHMEVAEGEADSVVRHEADVRDQAPVTEGDVGESAANIPIPDDVTSCDNAAESRELCSDDLPINDPEPVAPRELMEVKYENFAVTESIEQLGNLYKGSGAKKCVPLMRYLLGVGVPKLNRDEQNRTNRAKKFAMEHSIRMVLMKQTTTQQQQQAHGQQRHQALVLMCRIYVGSISFELREDAVRQAFIPFGPIKLIDMPRDPIAAKHKGFAFVEYETPEAAQLAQDHMHNAILGGRNVKVGRPSNMPQAQVIIQQIREESKAYSRVYVSSIHPSLTENDIRCVFEAFGTINACKLAMGGVGGSHKGYCYIDYATHQAANEAVTGMNLFDLGGQFLRVGRCCSPPQALEILSGALPPTTGPGVSMPAAASLAAATASAKLQAMEEEQRRQSILQMSLHAPLPPIPAQVVSPAPVPPTPVPVAAPIPPPPAAPAQPAALPPPGVANVTHLGSTVMSQPTSLLPQPAPLMPPPVGLAMTPAAVAAVVLQMANSAVPLLQQQQQQQPQHVADPQQLHRLVNQLQQPTHAKPDELSQDELRRRLEATASEDTQTLQQQEEISVRGSAGRQLVMQRLMRPEKPNVVVVLRNMVTPEEVDGDLQDEITEECNRFGQTVRVVIYQEAQSEDERAEVIVKIFVEFKEQSEAEAAVDGLNGRYFGGRLVRAELYDMNLYEQKDLSS